MPESIGPSPHAPLQPSHPPSENIQLLAEKMGTQAQAFAEKLQKLLEDPSLTGLESFLQELAANGIQLNHTVEQANLVRDNAPRKP
jgi:hypothetical protein